MEKNAKIYKVIKEKGDKKYVNYYVEINGFSIAIEPKFLDKVQYRALYYLVPNKEVK